MPSSISRGWVARYLGISRRFFFETGAEQVPQRQDRTATADGTGTGTISPGTHRHVAVTSNDVNHIITLPAPVRGTRITLRNGATGYEIRTSAPATVAINGGAGANFESAIPANTLVQCVCDTTTTWICTNFSTAGAVTATEPANNV